MKRLILMRHAKSDWGHSLSDFDRPLNARGIRSARALGDWLRAGGHVPDASLVSSARRTRETWALLGLDAAPRFVPALYEAETSDMIDILRGAEGDTVLMLGHNPAIGECAHALVKAAPEHARFADYPTGATLVADFDTGDWNAVTAGTGRVRDFIVARDLPGVDA